MPAIDIAVRDSNDLILDDDDPIDFAARPVPETAPWRILIVDDDVDVHVVTKFALSTSTFRGRRLSFLHAYSGKEAMAILRDTPDIALVLLDVIMETADAGLRVARDVRAELHNDLVRIVLRTGQPGQALEHSIIVDYDINDFWCKADLTTRKLFTTVIAALRAYATLVAAVGVRDALSSELTHAHNVRAAVNEHALVLTLDVSGRIVDANARLCALTGRARDELIGRALSAAQLAPFPPERAGEILAAVRRDGGWGGDIVDAGLPGAPLGLRCAVLAIKDRDGAIYQYLALASPLPAG